MKSPAVWKRFGCWKSFWSGLKRLSPFVRDMEINNLSKVKFHPHCHQRAEGPSADGIPSGVDATVQALSACGYDVELLEVGCCGMAGTFGYEAEHYDLSMKGCGIEVVAESPRFGFEKQIVGCRFHRRGVPNANRSRNRTASSASAYAFKGAIVEGCIRVIKCIHSFGGYNLAEIKCVSVFL